MILFNEVLGYMKKGAIAQLTIGVYDFQWRLHKEEFQIRTINGGLPNSWSPIRVFYTTQILSTDWKIINCVKGEKSEPSAKIGQLEITDPGLKELLKQKEELVRLTKGKQSEEVK